MAKKNELTGWESFLLMVIIIGSLSTSAFILVDWGRGMQKQEDMQEKIADLDSQLQEMTIRNDNLSIALRDKAETPKGEPKKGLVVNDCETIVDGPFAHVYCPGPHP